MEYVSDDFQACAELARILKKNGRIAITVPTYFSELIYNADHPITKGYHKFLVMSLSSNFMRRCKKFCNNYFPKSVIIYAWKKQEKGFCFCDKNSNLQKKVLRKMDNRHLIKNYRSN